MDDRPEPSDDESADVVTHATFSFVVFNTAPGDSSSSAARAATASANGADTRTGAYSSTGPFANIFGPRPQPSTSAPSTTSAATASASRSATAPAPAQTPPAVSQPAEPATQTTATPSSAQLQPQQPPEAPTATADGNGGTISLSFEFNVGTLAPPQPPAPRPRRSTRYNLRPRPAPSGLPPVPLNTNNIDNSGHRYRFLGDDDYNSDDEELEQHAQELDELDEEREEGSAPVSRLVETLMREAVVANMMQMMRMWAHDAFMRGIIPFGPMMMDGGIGGHQQGQPPASIDARSALLAVAALTAEQLIKCPSCVICQETFHPGHSADSSRQPLRKSPRLANTATATASSTSAASQQQQQVPAMRQMPCSHIFHQNCLFRWLEQSNQCPTCRYEIMTENVDYNATVTQRMAERDRQIAAENDRINDSTDDSAETSISMPKKRQKRRRDAVDEEASEPVQPTRRSRRGDSRSQL